MSKPTREQIEAWHNDATMGTKVLDLPHFARCAYAAGRRAGMMEASHVCMARAHANAGPDATEHTRAKRTEARNCGFAIRAAMEAAK